MGDRKRDNGDNDGHGNTQQRARKAHPDKISERERPGLTNEGPHTEPGERRPGEESEAEIEERHALRQCHQTGGSQRHDQGRCGKPGIDRRHAPPRGIKARDAHRMKQRTEDRQADQGNQWPQHGDQPLRHANAIEQDDQRAAEHEERAGEGDAPIDARPLLAEFAGPVLPHAVQPNLGRPLHGPRPRSNDNWRRQATIVALANEGMLAEEKTRIVIADDHPLVRGALSQALSGAIHAEIVETADLDGLTRELATHPDPDLVLLDLAMPGMRGLSGLLYLRAQHPAVPVAIVPANEDRGVIRSCLEAGALGFIPKTTPIDTMRDAVRRVLKGEVWIPADVDLAAPADQETADIVRRLSSLTPQQARVLMMLSEGLLNKQIAYELSVSEATVKAHVSAILTKLGVESRTQAVIAAGKIGGVAG